MSKTIVFVSDTHCGSVYGLTPPEHWIQHYKKEQEESWISYKNLTEKWVEPDILVCNGDAIEGNQKKQGGAELITSDRNVQVEMAEEALCLWKAKQTFLTYGTKYHVSSDAEDFEYNLAKKLDAKIEGRLFLNIEGLIFDIRHKIGSSNIPHGRFTALAKEVMWDLIKEAKESGPKIDVVVRSHVHYHKWLEEPKKIAFITPCLQLARGRYGSRECVGEIDWGAIRLTIDNGEITGKDIFICTLHANKPQVIRVE